ncbi:MAG TPA: shikimate dehydrogenase, partial [Chitinophagaceae bacterium]|nr:shikimate dehydrogenase [Chitinophagaceae bacterium]
NERMMESCKLVINTTPLGTFPGTEQCPDLPYELFTPAHLAYDLVYNPAQTLFLRRAAEKGALTVNGLSMLQLQAEKSWEIWNS